VLFLNQNMAQTISPTHEGHELLPEEQRSTQQKVVLFHHQPLHCQIFGLKYDERDVKESLSIHLVWNYY
jgi:hypothetical protein